MNEINQLYYVISDKPSQLDRILYLVSLYLEEVGISTRLSLRDVRISNPRVITDDPYLDTEIDFRIIRTNFKGPKFTVIRFKRDALDHSLVKVFSMGNNVYEILPIDHGFDDVEGKDYTNVFVDYLSKDTDLVLNAVKQVIFKDGKYQITFKDETVFNSDKFIISQAQCVVPTPSEETPLNPPVSDHEVIIEDEEYTPTDEEKESNTEPSREDLDNTVDQPVEPSIETPDESPENTEEETNTPDAPVEDNTPKEETPVENNPVEDETPVSPREEETQETPITEESNQEDTVPNQPNTPVEPRPKPKLYYTSRVYKRQGENQYRQEIVIHGEEDPEPMFDKGYAIICTGYVLNGDVTNEMHEKAMSVKYENNSIYVKPGDTGYEYLYIAKELPVDLVYTFTKELIPS